MKALFSEFVSNPYFIIFMLILLLCIIEMIKKGKINKIGKDGIEFNNTASGNRLKQIEDALLDVQKAVLRLQIINDNVSYETKLKLYDEYKSIGGNSYIDEYIREIKNKHREEN